jgi:Spx/MgsR family transcriptional regulator
MKIYGIKTCDNVRRAIKFFKVNDIPYELIDFKKVSVGKTEIENWLKKVSIDTLLNHKGSTYRTLKLKELNLDEHGKKEWLIKENMLIKRPVIEYNDKVIVAFDEARYKEIFNV